MRYLKNLIHLYLIVDLFIKLDDSIDLSLFFEMSNNNLNVLQEGSAERDAVSGRGQFTREVKDTARFGRTGLVKDHSRLFNYDRIQGASDATMKFEVDKADRLNIDRAAELMHRIHQIHGVDRVLEGQLYDYDNALFICYALNGGSQLGPFDRIKYYVMHQGTLHTFEYQTVHDVLDTALRRFFRTYANQVVDACRNLYENCDYADESQVHTRDMMIQLAETKGIRRYPYLVADCCDAATNIDTNQLTAVILSKQSVVGATTNAVDKRNLAIPIRSSDNYDSSIGTSVPVGVDINAGGKPNYYT